MNKKILISIFITTLFITTMFAPSVFGDRTARQNEDITVTILDVPSNIKARDTVTADTLSVQPKKQSQPSTTPLRNNPLVEPYNPNPADGDINVPILQHSYYGKIEFSWMGDNPDGNFMIYQLAFGTTNPPQQIGGLFYGTHSTDGGPFTQTYYPENYIIQYDTTYYWRIIAHETGDGIYNVQPSQVWSFTTERDPSLVIEPNNPIPSNGATDVELLLCPFQTNTYNNLVLEWDADDPGHYVQYRLYLGETNPPQNRNIFCHSEDDGHFSKDLSQWLYPDGCFLEYNTKYYWQIKTLGLEHSTPDGPVWNFTTERDPSLIMPHTPNPADGETCVELLYVESLDSYESLRFEWYGGTSDTTKKLVYFISVDTENPPQTEPVRFCSSIAGNYGPFGRDYWLGPDVQYNAEYFWQITVKELYSGGGLTGTELLGPVWSFTTAPEPLHITSVWSCAKHDKVANPIKFSVLPETIPGTSFGLVEPRNQYRDVNSLENDLYIEIVFDRDVSHLNLDVSISPSISFVLQNTAPNMLNIQYISKIPNGEYCVSITNADSHGCPTDINEEFTISYLNGDVTGDGTVNSDDISEIFQESNWLQKLVDSSYMSMLLLTPNPRCDINRNGVVEGLDIAQVKNSYGLTLTNLLISQPRGHVPNPLMELEEESISRPPRIIEAWSCASHNGMDDIKLPINLRDRYGVIDPRDQSHNVNDDVNDMYIEIVFDSAVPRSNLDVFILNLQPSEYTMQYSSADTIKIEFTSKIPNGIYRVLIVQQTIQQISIVGRFSVSYLNGDVNGDAVVNARDRHYITLPENWLNSQSLPDMRCDINRDGIINGLDIARVCNSANWEQSI